ncbi:TPA: ribosome-associated translation inhibitor RaiA [Patescibacteria group bacterium]|nr:MAG: Sigma 54 modulation protein/ribosomal protein S30EA [Parcubacteria group bacterium GW2011_GWF2_40_10]KKR46987.1 MAG: Sigma 54 modulation protein/ribosomal protein S30EA [Parcubacteria group bacterium GW2011_GWA2_40_143]KKR59184.1 MAG: Sigma 54 modulation protein/ribosomal protein S30EA [Parcubacteria group bacterium GW2011_GWC2_40_31]KKR74875.1 MAG: Sigma 54 modulation protein/ribosomal protein S30EA [Parcubacteria group bacterium GW2011_GWB2_40_8]KKR76190.1 MAG: Sigma 54 modulation pro
MNINIKATNIELTPELKNYVEQKVNVLEKHIYHEIDDSVKAWVEVGKISEHHQKGDVYRAEIQIHIPRNAKGARAEATHYDIFAAIDKAQDEIKIEIEKEKNKKVSLARRGGRLFKKLIPFFGE